MKLVYFKVRLDYFHPDLTILDSVRALPGVIECESMYPDDPALSNIVLVMVEPEEQDQLFSTIVGCQSVEFVEIIDKPVPR